VWHGFSFTHLISQVKSWSHCIRAIIWREATDKDAPSFIVDSHCLWISLISLTSSLDTLTIIRREKETFHNESITSFPSGNKSPSTNKHKGIYSFKLWWFTWWAREEQGLRLSSLSNHWGSANNAFPQERTRNRGAEERYYSLYFLRVRIQWAQQESWKVSLSSSPLQSLSIPPDQNSKTKCHHFVAFKYPMSKSSSQALTSLFLWF
jgi:hypothetical protein